MHRPPMSDAKAVRQYLCDQVDRISAAIDALTADLAVRCREKETRIRCLEINGSARKANQAWTAWLLKWIVLPALLGASTFAGTYLARANSAGAPSPAPPAATAAK